MIQLQLILAGLWRTLNSHSYLFITFLLYMYIVAGYHYVLN